MDNMNMKSVRISLLKSKQRGGRDYEIKKTYEGTT